MIMNQNAKISENINITANANGGGLCIDGGSVTMSDGEISGNTAGSSFGYGGTGYGSGVYVTNGGSMVINGGKIAGNTSVYGGGICIQEKSNVTMHGGEISNNNAFASGGGIYIEYKGMNSGRFAKISVSPDGKSGVIYGSSAGPGANTATNGEGAAIYDRTTAITTVREDTLGQFDEY
jgi:hypothetical protein